MNDQRFLPEYRVRRSEDFRRAYKLRKPAVDRLLVVYGHRNGLNHPRLGIAVSRRVGGAVQRNRWKRLLREAFRLTRNRLPDGMDLIVVPRPGIKPTLAELLESLPRLAAKATDNLQ